MQKRDYGGLVVAATLDNDTPRKGLTIKMVQVQCGLLTITTGFLIVITYDMSSSDESFLLYIYVLSWRLDIGSYNFQNTAKGA